MSSNEALNRRAFLTSTGALLVTLAAPSDWAAAAINGAAARPPVTGDQLDSYITINRDGTVVAYYGKIDGGQGLGTAIAQMVAEEIDVARPVQGADLGERLLRIQQNDAIRSGLGVALHHGPVRLDVEDRHRDGRSIAAGNEAPQLPDAFGNPWLGVRNSSADAISTPR